VHPAEFRTLREHLFLSEKDVSMLTLVKEAQIKKWEAGGAPVPEGTAGLLSDIDRELQRREVEAISRAKNRETLTLIRITNPAEFKRAGPVMDPIPAFLAYKCHCALIALLFIAFKVQGKTVSIRYYSSES